MKNMSGAEKLSIGLSDLIIHEYGFIALRTMLVSGHSFGAFLKQKELVPSFNCVASGNTILPTELSSTF